MYNEDKQNRSRRHARLSLLVVVLVIAAAVWPATAQEPDAVQPAAAEFKAGELIVGFDSPVLAALAADLRERVGASLIRPLLLEGVELWQVPAGRELAIAGQLEAEAGVAYAHPNYRYQATDLPKGPDVTPNDPGFANQWGHTRMRSTSAWNFTTGSNALTIAIIDTGIDETHPDLSGKIVAGYDFVDGDTNPHDLNGHGTHCAGIAAASTNNSVGVAGMNWQARIMPVRVLDETGSGYDADVTDGIVWAYTNGAKVLSLSLGGSASVPEQQTAINNAHAAGALVVAAMGNNNSAVPSYPAAYDNVLAVAATGPDDSKASYSNRGPHCDISAPGGDMGYLHDPAGIYSTMPTYPCDLNNYGYSMNYDYLNGTSQATPYVSGLAGLIWALEPTMTPDEVQGIIELTAVDLGSAGWDQYFGHGRINAWAAMLALRPPNYDNAVMLPIMEKGFSRPRRIVYTSGYTDADPQYDVYVMNSDGTGQTRLTFATSDSYRAPAWSPDRTQIAFHANLPSGDQRIYVMNADGSGLHLLFSLAGHHSHPTWSPDGLKIAFSSDLHDPGVDTPNDIYVINSDGTGAPVNLTNTTGASESQPDWSPDGLKIAYVSEPIARGKGTAGEGAGAPPSPPPTAARPGGVPSGRIETRSQSTARIVPPAPLQPGAVLWDQPLGSNVDTYANQDFETINDSYDIFIADDFTNGESWDISTIFVPGSAWNAGNDLTCASTLHWQIYANSGGVPAGNPWSGGAYWSLSLSPYDSQVSLSTGVDGWLTNVTLNLASPLSLPPGTWWLVFYPEAGYTACGQFGRHAASTTNGADAQVINPGGGLGFPTTWTSVQSGSTWSLPEQDFSFRLEGTVGTAGDLEIYVMNANGTGKLNITNSPYDDWGPAWSPNSSQLAFYRDLDTGSGEDNEIYRMNANGTSQTRLTNSTGQNYYPAWSPSGAQIVFQAYSSNYADLYVMNSDGSGVVNLTNHQYSYASTMPDW